MTRNVDVNYMKTKYSELYCKMIIPENMFEQEFPLEDLKEIEEFKEQNKVTINIVIKYEILIS